MAPSSSTVLLGSALLVAAAAATTYYSSKGSSSRDIAEIGEDDFITDDDVAKIFDRLFIEMQAVVAHISQQIQQIQMTGKSIPEAQIRQILKVEFERQLATKQQQVMEDFDVDEDCLEEATWEFLEKEDDYPKVKRAVERFQLLYSNISGQEIPKRPGMNNDGKAAPIEILPASKVVEVAEVYFAALTSAMQDICKKFQDDGKDLKSPEIARELHMEFAGVANEKGDEALKTLGVTTTQFQKSIEANASDPKVGRALGMLQMKQQQALISMGVPAL